MKRVLKLCHKCWYLRNCGPKEDDYFCRKVQLEYWFDKKGFDKELVPEDCVYILEQLMEQSNGKQQEDM